MIDMSYDAKISYLFHKWGQKYENYWITIALLAGMYSLIKEVPSL